MTVGFLINTCEPFYRGGYERRAWAFARELARTGHDVRIYTSCPRDEIIDGVRFIRLAPLRPFFNQRGVRNGWADLLFALDILKLLWKLRPGELDVLDVCATPFLHLPMVAVVSWFRKVPVILTCHEALLSSLRAYAGERGYTSPVIKGIITGVLAGIYRLGMRLFPRRLAVSHRTATALEKEGYPAQGTVEFGLEPEAFSSQPPVALPAGTPVRFIYCGRLTPIKGVHQTVALFLSFERRSIPFHFDIIGEGNMRRGIESQLARHHGLEKSVTLHGEVSEEKKRVLLSQAEVFVLSSPREGFSIATLEAMAQGCCALVVSDPERPNGALDFVRDGSEGRVAQSGERMGDKTLQAVLRLIQEDHASRLALRQAAWKKAQDYKIETQAGKLMAFYGDSLAGKRR
jgi:glycosyltransferase involved in cell wall biosynthesis